ncbi:5'-nucleotidase, lipoprotein e(P4) family [Ectobacillus panaciterrae]|uniref:5'-nucleotidase, lipoprotein e(P4) family n=1 Tax=Ectobacillus panaciterrae TaxID=363872 RepID=UPI0004119569|nr:5'-nucleotidase, lipoprotein e(P4) family [Ectobacillus panaciterrae]
MKKIIALCSAAVLSLSLSSFSAGAMAPPGNLQEQNTMSVLWYQTSGEARALYYQGYNIGKMKLEAALRKKPKQMMKKPAVVLDLDETVLDNSPVQAWAVKTGQGYPAKWEEWIQRAEAAALPGAIDFLKYADQKGVDIYYISNRKAAQGEATLKNLKRIGAPQANMDHVLLQQPGEKGKEARRQKVAQTHEIVLLFGDNLADFSGFDNKTVTERNQITDQKKAEFGDKLIIFPNPMYGDWESAIYQYDFKKSDEEKSKLRRSNLKPFQP